MPYREDFDLDVGSQFGGRGERYWQNYIDQQRRFLDEERRGRNLLPPGTRPPTTPTTPGSTPTTPAGPGRTPTPTTPGRSWLAERSRGQNLGQSAWQRWVESQRFRGRVNAPIINKERRKSLLAVYGDKGPSPQELLQGSIPGRKRNPIAPPPSAPPGSQGGVF